MTQKVDLIAERRKLAKTKSKNNIALRIKGFPQKFKAKEPVKFDKFSIFKTLSIRSTPT